MSHSPLFQQLRHTLSIVHYCGSPVLVVITQAYSLAISRFSAFLYHSFCIICYVFHQASGRAVYFIARTNKTVSVERLILGGVAVSALFGAIQSTLLLLADDGRIQAALNWLIGSLNGRGWAEVTVAGP